LGSGSNLLPYECILSYVRIMIIFIAASRQMQTRNFQTRS
jgi:hypothetical protein